MATKRPLETVRDYAVMRRGTGDSEWKVSAWHEDGAAALSDARKCAAESGKASLILMRVAGVVLGGAEKV